MTSKPQFVDVAIVGAGFSGLYLLHRCRKLGLSAHILEAGSGVGGTWYWNRYPGARCDIESMQYSFQFDDQLQQDWDWSERYASQPEILTYAEHVADRFNLRDGISFGHRVQAVTFDASSSTWTLTTDRAKTLTARFVIMATGCLSKPNWPNLSGFDTFAGAIHHTAQWPHERVDFAGKRVAVIGTGSSGIQTIPCIARDAQRLRVFQRTANYSVPAHNCKMDPEVAAQIKATYGEMRARAKTTPPGIDGRYNTGSAMDVSESERLAEYERRWQEGGLTFIAAYGDLMLNRASNASLAEFVRGKIRETVKDPKVADRLCPNTIIGGKRLCVDTDYYATFNRDNTELVDIQETPITAIVESGIQTIDRLYAVDMIVVATGFDAMTGALNAIDIRGKSDQSLQHLWRNGPSSYLGLAMAGFPNLFTVTGPGSPSVLSNMLPSIEQHVEWITDCIAHLRDTGKTTIEATPAAEQSWWDHVQEIGRTGLKHQAESWYLGANIDGKPRVFMPYLGGCPAYREKCEQVADSGYQGFEIA